MKKLIITHMEVRRRPALVTALVGEAGLETLELAPPEENRLLGSIHVGKVQKVLSGLKGAFVEIEGKLPCYYAMEKEHHPIFRNEKKTDELKAGDELLVQVIREAMKLKAPSVSSNLSFPGEYLVLTTENQKVGVSSRIPQPERERLKEEITGLLPPSRDYGVIVRTNAPSAPPGFLARELTRLEAQKDAVLKKGMYSPCHTRIQNGDSRPEEAVKSCVWEELEKIVTDDPEIFSELSGYVEQIHPGEGGRVQLYEDRLLPLYKLFSLEAGLERALSERVWLKSGGFLMIQQTEACTVIDVNSGKQISARSKGSLIHELNQEAARECARQIRLRNLSGILLIDFVNMTGEDDRGQLLALMRNLVKTDRVTTRAVDVTALGLMELTRKKEKKTLREQWEELES